MLADIIPDRPYPPYPRPRPPKPPVLEIALLWAVVGVVVLVVWWLKRHTKEASA